MKKIVTTTDGETTSCFETTRDFAKYIYDNPNITIPFILHPKWSEINIWYELRCLDFEGVYTVIIHMAGGTRCFIFDVLDFDVVKMSYADYSSEEAVMDEFIEGINSFLDTYTNLEVAGFYVPIQTHV
jgi:hypothetical protein